MYDILFQNATVLTMVDAAPVFHGHVGIQGGRIAYMGQEARAAARVIACENRILMPGLINTHAHTAMCVLRGYADDYALQPWLFTKVFPAEARLTERAVLAGVRLGFAEMLSTGTTSLSDMYFYQPAAAQLALEVGIRASLCNAATAAQGAWNPPQDRAAQETFRLIQEYHGAGEGRILAEVAIHAEYTSCPAVWEWAAALAQSRGVGLQVHLSETEKEHAACVARYGKTPAALLAGYGVFEGRALAAHCVWLTPKDRALLAEKGVHAAHCPVSNLKLGSGIANITAMRAAGINISLGTDGCCSNNTHDLFEEIKLAALLAKGTTGDPCAVSAYDALKMATVNGAKAQGRADVGQAAVGMQADLILLDMHTPSTLPQYDPISAVVYSATGANVRLTMVQGRVLYEDGGFTTLDIEQAYAEAEYAKKLILG
ncbi:MAG: amidohydrolase [Christensenellaceae bacterium]|jgi:5-methylthioadenosine/S-adenosylhomocysteine deaminase|nr:amidohydrolase [Christensenellaceae bacterium]